MTDLKNQLLFLDCETTSAEKDARLVQIAYAQWDWEIQDHLFKPPVPISIGAMAIHHLTNEMVKDKDVFQESLVFLDVQNMSRDSIVVAHNAKFDLNILKNEWITDTPRHICTYKVAYTQLEKAEKHTLQYLRYFTGLYEFLPENVHAHDAHDDVYVLRDLFNYLTHEFTIEEMLEISSKPLLLRQLSFWKHKWIPLAQVPKSYLTWLAANFEFDDDGDDLRYTLRHYLGQVWY